MNDELFDQFAEQMRRIAEERVREDPSKKEKMEQFLARMRDSQEQMKSEIQRVREELDEKMNENKDSYTEARAHSEEKHRLAQAMTDELIKSFKEQNTLLSNALKGRG